MDQRKAQQEREQLQSGWGCCGVLVFLALLLLVLPW
jgi:hypothetical protein